MKMHEKIKINKLETRSRLVMPALATSAAADGKVSDELIEFYIRRCSAARMGLVITEHCYVSPGGRASLSQLSIAGDECIPGLSRLTRAIKATGCPVFAQLAHAGGATTEDICGAQPVSASPTPSRRYPASLPRELSREEISALTGRYADAALRAAEAGYDGVELHSAHGYLLNQFYSPLVNKRSDEYGPESLESRLRFHTGIIAGIRKRLGPDFPIAVRLGASDYMPGGSSLEDAAEAGRLLQAAGADMLDISGGLCGTSAPGRTGAFFRDAAESVRAAVSIPVMLTGGIRRGGQAEELVKAGAADLIGVGRALIADPSWADNEL